MKGVKMAVYLAWQIEKGNLDYKQVFAKKFFQTWKEQVDTILTADGYTIGDDGTLTAPEKEA
jgi:hypothetical protein